jgi:hypothetical protein
MNGQLNRQVCIQTRNEEAQTIEGRASCPANNPHEDDPRSYMPGLTGSVSLRYRGVADVPEAWLFDDAIGGEHFAIYTAMREEK